MTKKTYNKKKRNYSGKTITKNIALPHILIIAVLIIQNIVFLCIFFHLHNRYSNTLKNMTAEIGYIEQLNTQMHKMLNTLMIIDIIIIAITAVFAIYVLFSLIARNKQMQKELQKSEMRTLQAQINPHFLYNTLSTVTWMAESGRNSDVVNTTVALSDFFRITLSQGNDWIRLADEIEHVRSYLIIQQKRYRDILDFEINYDDELLGDCCCLKLILQPLVENALYHGIKYSREQGKITVSADKKGDMIYCEVTDNGAGMKPERLQEVLAMLNQDFDKNAQNNKSFGLYNVHKRLQLYYNMEEGLSIESAPNEGTKVSFSIPAYCRDDIEE